MVTSGLAPDLSAENTSSSVPDSNSALWIEPGVSSRSPAVATIMAATSFWLSDPELREREEEESEMVPSGCGETSVELGGVLELVWPGCEGVLDFRFLEKNQRPENPLPDLFLPESPRAISSASASVRDRELLSDRRPDGPPPPRPPLLEVSGARIDERFLTLTAGLSLRLKLRWRLWYLSKYVMHSRKSSQTAACFD